MADEDGTAGYLHQTYARSLAEFGRPRALPASGGWLLERQIAGGETWDATSCYPLFFCTRWAALSDDLRNLPQTLVSVVVVTDPFGGYSEGLLHEAFPDLVRPYKHHFVTDLRREPAAFVSAHARRQVRTAQRHVEVQVSHEPSGLVDVWTRLYANLIRRHGLTGVHRFSHESFRLQLAVPGCVTLVAHREREPVGMLLWYVQEGIAYYHLGAYSDLGYASRASFALFAASLEYFRAQGLGWVALGAGAGIESSTDDGLSRFKRGWSTGTRPAYLCGRVMDAQQYSRLSAGHRRGAYFPAYRAPQPEALRGEGGAALAPRTPLLRSDGEPAA